MRHARLHLRLRGNFGQEEFKGRRFILRFVRRREPATGDGAQSPQEGEHDLRQPLHPPAPRAHPPVQDVHPLYQEETLRRLRGCRP